jgi:hypothetical protein
MEKTVLNAMMTERAKLVNPYYSSRLKWTLPNGLEPGTREAAEWIANEQTRKGLRADGIMGPKTWASLNDQVYNPKISPFVTVGDKELPAPGPLVHFEDPSGISFYDNVGGWEPRENPTLSGVNLLVLHWDGARSAHDCFHTLVHRGLSVQLLLDGDGTMYQALDLVSARAWHVRGNNERSIGIEIQNPWRVGKYLRDFDTDLVSTGRPVVEETLPHTDQVWQHLDFTDEQKTALEVWVPFLCDALDIPLVFPTDENGNVPSTLCSPTFSGVCGHYHLQTDKVDPGLSLWPRLKVCFERQSESRGPTSQTV